MPTYYIMPETSGQLQAGGGLHISPFTPPGWLPLLPWKRVAVWLWLTYSRLSANNWLSPECKTAWCVCVCVCERNTELPIFIFAGKFGFHFLYANAFITCLSEYRQCQKSCLFCKVSASVCICVCVFGCLQSLNQYLLTLICFSLRLRQLGATASNPKQ